MTGWLPSLVLPKLTALILNGTLTEDVTPALEKFGNQLQTLGLKGSPMLSSSISAPPTLKLRHVIVRHDFARSEWHHLPRIVNMEKVEVFGMLVNDAMGSVLLRGHDASTFSDKFSALLRLVTDPQTMPSLSRVTLDLGDDRTSHMWPMVEVHLLRWMQQIHICRPGLQVYREFYDTDYHIPRCTPLFSLFGL